MHTTKLSTIILVCINKDILPPSLSCLCSCVFKLICITHTALGYTTKVYFNACCKPSPLFDQQKIPTHLPLSIGPGHLTETMRTVLQLLLDLCQDPLAALERIPSGPGPALIAHNADREIKSQGFPPPTKLSDYWSQLYKCASQLECCENFLSATTPSVPCLLCHPFGECASQKLLHANC